MAEQHEWLQVDLDASNRRGLADSVESTASADNPALGQLLRMLRSSRDELLFDQGQAELVLVALNTDQGMSALRARLEAFLGRR